MECAAPDVRESKSNPSSPPLLALKCVGVQLGGTVSRSVATSVVTNAALVAIENIGTTAATTALVSRAQLQALGLVALRLPLGNAERMHQFVNVVTEFTALHQASLVEIAEMTKAQQILQVGFQSNVVGALAAAAVQQSIAAAYLSAGWTTPGEFADQTVAIVLAGAGSLAGGVTGAACGTLLLPGVGTVLGSLLGSFGGSFAPALLRSTAAAKDGSAALTDARALKTVERDGEGYSDWLEIVDCSDPHGESFLRLSTVKGFREDEDTVTVLHAPASSHYGGSAPEDLSSASDPTIDDTDVVLYFQTLGEKAL